MACVREQARAWSHCGAPVRLTNRCTPYTGPWVTWGSRRPVGCPRHRTGPGASLQAQIPAESGTRGATHGETSRRDLSLCRVANPSIRMYPLACRDSRPQAASETQESSDHEASGRVPGGRSWTRLDRFPLDRPSIRTPRSQSLRQRSRALQRTTGAPFWLDHWSPSCSREGSRNRVRCGLFARPLQVDFWVPRTCVCNRSSERFSFSLSMKLDEGQIRTGKILSLSELVPTPSRRWYSVCQEFEGPAEDQHGGAVECRERGL